MQESIDSMRGHFIVCGCGRMGETICRYLGQRKKPFVVIDIDEERLVNACEANNWMYLAGDSTDDAVLLKAGIEYANSLASVLRTDADNVYVVLSARMLNSEMQIISRASEEKAIEKMETAGANRVISPFSTGAMKIVRFMLNPSIEDFLEIADSSGNDLQLADIQIGDDSPLIGQQLRDTNLRDQGVMVIGIYRANGERLMPPRGADRINAGDSLFAFGNSESVTRLISGNDDAT
jgi:voltage-gated potassium channel